MRRIVLLFLFAAVAGPAVGAGGEGKSALLDGVAAHVNNHTITIGDVMSLLVPIRQELQRKHSGKELEDELRKSYMELLDRLIDERLILDAYEEQKEGKIPEAVIDQQIEGIISRHFKGDRTALMAALAQDRMTYAEWREHRRRNLIVSNMRRLHVIQNTKVSPVEVRREYNRRAKQYVKPARVKLRVAVVKAGKRDDGETGEQVATRIIKAARGGHAFDELVRTYSSGTRAESGGDWGWVAEADLRQEFRDALAKMSAGDVSEPVHIDDEFYMLKIDDKEARATLAFADVQADIEHDLKEKEAKHVYDAWLARLREVAYIMVSEPGEFLD